MNQPGSHDTSPGDRPCAEAAPPSPARSARPRNRILEGVLELGRNWATATVIALAGIAAYRTEPVTTDTPWTRGVAWVAFAVATAWIYLAVLRFGELLPVDSRSLKGKAIDLLVFALLSFLGFGVILSIVRVSDNNHIVAICEQVADRPGSRVHQAPECRRLYERREWYPERLEQATSSARQ